MRSAWSVSTCCTLSINNVQAVGQESTSVLELGALPIVVYGRLPPVRAHQGPTALAVLAGAEHFSAAGMRYPSEVAIHNELYAIKYQIYFRDTFVFDRLIINNRQEQGQVIRLLDGSEQFNITPMLITMNRQTRFGNTRAYLHLSLLGSSRGPRLWRIYLSSLQV